MKTCFRQGEGQGQWEEEEESDDAGSVPGLWIPAKGSQPGQRRSAKSAQPGRVLVRRSVLALRERL